MVMTRPPAYHPGNFLMKNMNPTNSGLNWICGQNMASILNGFYYHSFHLTATLSHSL